VGFAQHGGKKNLCNSVSTTALDHYGGTFSLFTGFHYA